MAHVLDRDHRLVRKGCRERDLVVGKRPGHRACQDQNTDWGSFAEHRDSYHGAISSGTHNIRQVVFRIRRSVVDVNRSSL
jgi:hypothetical protein